MFTSRLKSARGRRSHIAVASGVVQVSLLVFSFPEKRQRTRMLGLWSAIVAGLAGLGPTVGGLLVSAFGWQSILLLNLPIGIIGILMTRRYIASSEGRDIKLAVPGHVLWIVALAALIFALIEGPQLSWARPPPCSPRTQRWRSRPRCWWYARGGEPGHAVETVSPAEFHRRNLVAPRARWRNRLSMNMPPGAIPGWA